MKLTKSDMDLIRRSFINSYNLDSLVEVKRFNEWFDQVVPDLNVIHYVHIGDVLNHIKNEYEAYRYKRVKISHGKC